MTKSELTRAAGTVCGHSEGVMDGPGLRQAVAGLGLVVGAVAVECALLVVAAVRELAWWELGLVHGLVVGCLVVWTSARWRRGCDVRFSAVAILGVATCGPLGAVGACLTFIMHATRRMAIIDPEAAAVSLLSTTPQREADRSLQRILSGSDSVNARAAVASFNDVMALGSLEEKRAAISLMVARFQPEFTPALKRALRDADPAIRVQAATAVSRLENLFQRRVLELEQKANLTQITSVDGDDGSAARIMLAQYLDEVAESGLLDEQRTVSWRERALSLYRGEQARRVQEVALPIGRVLVRLGRETEACDWFDTLPPSLPITARLLYWRLEALYRARRYGQLRELCGLHRPLLAAGPDAPPSVLAAVALWGARA